MKKSTMEKVAELKADLKKWKELHRFDILYRGMVELHARDFDATEDEAAQLAQVLLVGCLEGVRSDKAKIEAKHEGAFARMDALVSELLGRQNGAS